tara:strand:- start:201 stop:638 length:438 start_codon:yes stop_codon:yes gene_type:complete
MIMFNQSDEGDRKKQLEYLNTKPEYQEDKLRLVPEQMKSFDFWNLTRIIEFKKRKCDHDTFPNWILEQYKYEVNMEIANKHNILFFYQNKFNDGKIWEWNITKMVEKNLMPEPQMKEMNRHTFVTNPEKVPKKVYMLTLDMGYQI